MFEAEHPDTLLVEALQSLDPVLRYPVVLVGQPELICRRVTIRRLRLMGESPDQFPSEVELTDGLERSQELE